MSVVSLELGQSAPPAVRGGFVAVGNFDGVHLGHASLIATARDIADPGGPVVALTFNPHPLALLSPERYMPPLTTMPERARVLQTIGVDHVAIMKTTHELLSLSPIEFFGGVLGQSLAARGVVEGFNFRFGRNREGSNQTLLGFCHDTGMKFREVSAFELDGKPVSSSRVRDAIVAGDVTAATTLLNRPYRITGTVVTGAKRGRTIGFPTANLEEVETLLPAVGVYAVRAMTTMGPFAGAANIGPNPTFGEDARKVEVHLLDFAGDLYGQSMSVDFVARLRDTQKFTSVLTLSEQMTRDVEQARRILSQEP
jgi:riboflavin kinase/FMN adenylyltransferase